MIYKFSIGLNGYIDSSIVQSTSIDIDNVAEAIKAEYTPAYIEAVYTDGRRIKIEDLLMRIVLIEDENLHEYYPYTEWFIGN